jgi:hypothetical protein
MEIKQTSMTATPTYLGCDGNAYEYEPSWNVTTLGWYNISQCARKRMTDNSYDVPRWRGSRRSFYNALRMMQVDEVQFMDD